MKRETLQGRKRWNGASEARPAVFRWATRYNIRRRHSRLGQISPITYERAQLRWPPPHDNRCPRSRGRPPAVRHRHALDVDQPVVVVPNPVSTW